MKLDWQRWFAFCVALFACLTLHAQVLPYKAPEKSLGVVTCASSLCHGSIAKWAGSNVHQNEYVIWSRLDKHARAYKVLLNAQSVKIAEKLGLPAPAHQSAVCLDCHAHNPINHAKEHHVSDGVSCEACHGAAEKWIGEHTASGITHSQNLKLGLYPSDEPQARARLCLSCHFGNTDKYVTHRMMAAGHPRLSFEVNTFTAIQPAHFQVDADYAQRKGAHDDAKHWAVGQAVAVISQLEVLRDAKRGRDGVFPELTLFDCHACHHPMSDARWQPKSGFGNHLAPGLVRLNDSSSLMLYQILRQISPAAAADFKTAVSKLNLSIAGQGDMSVAAKELLVLAEKSADELSVTGIPRNMLWRVALSLVDDGLNGTYKDYAGAEQATMALGSVVSVLHQQLKLKFPAEINQHLARVRKALANDEKFSVMEFQQSLKGLRVPLVSGLDGQNTSAQRSTP